MSGPFLAIEAARNWLVVVVMSPLFWVISIVSPGLAAW